MSVRLETYKGPKSRYKCPRCQKLGEFTRYVDDNGQYIADDVGRCNREDRCGFHNPPKNHFLKDPPRNYTYGSNVSRTSTELKKLISGGFDVLPPEAMFETFNNYENNNFFKFLVSLTDEGSAYDLVQKYFIGTSIHWEGSTAFWQIDTNGRVRQLKTILFNPNSGKRVKSEGSAKKWDYNKMAYFDDFNGIDKTLVNGRFIAGGRYKNLNLKQCLFGEHLLKGDGKVAIVESEKTAIIASHFYPNFIWLATGGSNGAGFTKPEVIQVLNNREVIFFPDLGKYDNWNEKINDIRKIISFKVCISDFLEKNASVEEKDQGLDIADYFINSQNSDGRKDNNGSSKSNSEIIKNSNVWTPFEGCDFF